MFYGLAIHKDNLIFLKGILVEEGGIKKVLSSVKTLEKIRKIHEERLNSKDFMGKISIQKLSTKKLKEHINEVKEICINEIEENQKVL